MSMLSQEISVHREIQLEFKFVSVIHIFVLTQFYRYLLSLTDKLATFLLKHQNICIYRVARSRLTYFKWS